MTLEQIDKTVNLLKNIIYISIFIGFWYVIFFNFSNVKSLLNDVLSGKENKNFKTTKIEYKRTLGTSGWNTEIVETKELIDSKIKKDKKLTNKENGKESIFQSRLSKVIDPKNYTELYYKNLNELLKVKNPTSIILENVEEVKWVGDSEFFYTLNAKNTEKVPAHNFKYELLLNEKFKFKKSNSSKIFYAGYTIKEKQLTSFPIVTKSDLAKLYNVKHRKILGMGLSVNIPDSFSKMANEIKGYTKYSKKSATSTYEFPIKITYTTIFGDDIKLFTSLYVYIDDN